MPPQRPEQRSDNRTRFGPRLPPELWRMVLQGLAEAHRRDRYQQARARLEQRLEFPSQVFDDLHQTAAGHSFEPGHHTFRAWGDDLKWDVRTHFADDDTRRVVVNKSGSRYYDPYGRTLAPP